MIKLGFQGVSGAYSELAARQYFDVAVNAIGFTDFPGLLQGLVQAQIDYAMLPIENTSAGTVITALDSLAASEQLFIHGEYALPIRHSLLALAGASIDSITSVYSHPQALAQCQHYLAQHKLEPVPYYDTAGAAAFVASEQNPKYGAIASELAGQHYGLQSLATNMADFTCNQTRFLLLASHANQSPSGAKLKTSLWLELNHEPNALARVLTILGEFNFNLTKITSRPKADSPWQYQFLLEYALGSDDLSQQRQALRQISPFCYRLRELGTYQAWVNRI